jgi:hypothetical protein
LLVCAAAPPAGAQVPGRINYQGLLLDATGQPVNGSVTLVFELYPTAAGGTALWTETHSGVAVTDGIYDVALGSQTPLTPAILSPSPRFLQVTVNGELLAPRRELLAVPYALEAERAANVGGAPSEFVVQLFEHTDADGNGFVNSHPIEGVADADGDGVANFLEADNDADGSSDAAEVSGGDDPNLVTPQIAGFAPPEVVAGQVATVTVNGLNFDEPGLSVAFGTQTPTPINLTATSFDVSVGPQAQGTVSVVVSLGNGESDQSTFPFVRAVTAFATSTTYDGNLGGVAGADAKCAARAGAAGLSGTYVAWITDGTSGPNVSYVLPTVFRRTDGVQFADSLSELSGGMLNAPLNRDEFGASVAGGVWTGGGSSPAGSSCSLWASALSFLTGTVGSTAQTNSGWQNLTQTACSGLQRLYCFEQ